MPRPSSSAGTYVAIFAALIALTALTVIASYVNLGRLNPAVAVGIAGGKATLVALYFMHLRGSSRLLSLYAVGGLLWLSILIVLVLGEAAHRPAAEPDPLPLATGAP